MEVTKLPPHKVAAAKRLVEKEQAKLNAVAEYQPPHKAIAARRTADKEKMKTLKALADNEQAHKAVVAREKLKAAKSGMPTTLATLPRLPTQSLPTFNYKGRYSSGDALVAGPADQEKASENFTVTNEEGGEKRIRLLDVLLAHGNGKKRVSLLDRSMPVAETVAAVPHSSIHHEQPKIEEPEPEQIAGESAMTAVVPFKEATPEPEDDMALALADIAEIERDIELAKAAKVPPLMLCEVPATTADSDDLNMAEMELDILVAKRKATAPAPRLRVLVDNIHLDITEADLLAIFETVGPVDSFRYQHGTASVLYHDTEHALQAIRDFDGKPANGQTVYLKTVEVAREKTNYVTGDFWNDVHDDAWDITHTETGEVRREFQFREGNYDIAFAALKRTLEPCGQWERVNSPDWMLKRQACYGQDQDCLLYGKVFGLNRPHKTSIWYHKWGVEWENVMPPDDSLQKLEDGPVPHANCPGNLIENWQQRLQDRWALDQILSFVCSSFKQRWPIEKPLLGPQLMKSLRDGCPPFRLMDLSFELRLNVYQWMVDEDSRHFPIRIGIHCFCAKLECGMDPEDDDDIPRHRRDRLKVPLFLRKERPLHTLSSVSREFRKHTNEIFFSRNDFHFDVFYTGHGLEDLLGWVSRVGMWRLRDMRALNVFLDLDTAGFAFHRFHVTFRPNGGLRADYYLAKEDGTPVTKDHDVISGHLAMITRRKMEEKWKSTGVMEFFTADPNALRLAVLGRSRYDYVENEEEEVNERDAYQVSYGPSFRRVQATPW